MSGCRNTVKLKFNCEAPLEEKEPKEKKYGALGMLIILYNFFLPFFITLHMFLTVLRKFKNISPIFLLSSYCDANFIYIRTIFQKFQMTIISFVIKL